MATTIADLSITLVRAESGLAFVTSDNPVFKYNTYCEGLTDIGVIGTKCRGLQLFFPVSPTLLLYLFDGAAYKLVRPRGRATTASADDVRALNRLQIVNAQDNVYLHSDLIAPWLAAVAPEAEAIRAAMRPRVTEAVEEGNENSRLLHQFWPMPQLALDMSFTEVRRSAQAVPLPDRAPQQRGTDSSPSRHSEPTGVGRRFNVRSSYL